MNEPAAALSSPATVGVAVTAPPPATVASAPAGAPAATAPAPASVPMAAASVGAAVGVGGAGQENRPLEWGRLIRGGWHLLKAARWLVAAYAALYLLNGAAPRVTALLFGQLTTQIPALTAPAAPTATTAGSAAIAPAAPDPAAARREAKATYASWLGLTLGTIVAGIILKLVTVALDWRMTSFFQRQLFGKIVRQSPEFFNRNQPGELTMIVNQLTIEAELTLRTLLLEPVLQLVLLVGTAGLLLSSFSAVGEGPGIPLLYKLLLLGGALFSPFLVTRLGGRLQTSATGLRDRNLALSGLVNGVLGSPEEIQALRAEPVFIAKHAEAVRRLSEARLRQSVTVEGINALNNLPTLAATAAFLGFALYLALQSQGAANVGAIVSVALLAPMFMSPVQALASFLIMARTCWPSIDTTLGLLEAPNPASDAPGARDLPTVAPTLEVKDVTFRYRPDLPPVFNHLSFHVPPGEVTGLVARMGQGKTTLFRLALRFYDAQEGQILLGGHPTADFTLDSLRRHATVMSQFPAFFHDTLRENLRLAKPDATDDELRAVCQRTGMWAILEERLGVNPLDVDFAAGRKLSGGQKKLLALTRCLLREPTFLFLDEPTAGMDNLEKFHLLPMLREACRGRTVMVIDHDVHWLMRFCDGFVVLDQGGVAEQGRGADLLAGGGLLAQLHHEAEVTAPATPAAA